MPDRQPTASPVPEARDERPLSDVPVGLDVRLLRFELPPAEVEPLLERGVLPGRVLRTVRRAPTGMPVVRVAGSVLALRRETAAGLVVTPLVPGR